MTTGRQGLTLRQKSCSDRLVMGGGAGTQITNPIRVGDLGLQAREPRELGLRLIDPTGSVHFSAGGQVSRV